MIVTLIIGIELYHPLLLLLVLMLSLWWKQPTIDNHWTLQEPAVGSCQRCLRLAPCDFSSFFRDQQWRHDVVDHGRSAVKTKPLLPSKCVPGCSEVVNLQQDIPLMSLFLTSTIISIISQHQPSIMGQYRPFLTIIIAVNPTNATAHYNFTGTTVTTIGHYGW